jgi:predicted lipoprotein with Yx(FWY)xxD motif
MQAEEPATAKYVSLVTDGFSAAVGPLFGMGGDEMKMKAGIVAVAAVGALVLPQIAAAQSSGPAKVEAKEKQPFGKYLAEADGQALYMFTADSKGSSNCYEACAKAWPPLTSAGKPEAGPGVQASKLGTIQRKDGSHQVTYNGQPLYAFVKDKGPGTTTGQDVKGFGGEWYLVSPQGKKIEKE